MPVGEAMVSKGQRSMRKIVSGSVIFAFGRAIFSRDVIAGIKVDAKVLWAACLVL